MNTNKIARFNAPALEYLTADQLRQVHESSLDILENVGTVFHHDEALDLLLAAGARLISPKRVSIPSRLVDQALASAPAQVTVFDRTGQPALLLQEQNVYYGTGSDCPFLLDSFTGERRPFNFRDVADSIRLVDALPHLDFTMCNGLAEEIDPTVNYQKKYALMLQLTTKPQVITAANRSCLNDIANLAACVRGGRKQLSEKPIFVLYDEPTSPLVHSLEATEKLLFMAENRLPINYSPGMMAGATGPVTMAGAIALANAEILAGLVVHQLKQPGAPFVFGAGMSPMDMNSMQPTYSAPEAMVAQAGLCQLGRQLYRLPTWGFAGCSASKLADEQAVIEATSYIMMAGWMGTNLVHDVGYLEFGLTYSFDVLVLCDEFIGQVRRMMEGIKVDPEHLALDAIKRVGPGGHFLNDPHTFRHFRQNWKPGLTNRQTYEKWQEKGATSMGQRAKEKVKSILENHQPEQLPQAVEQEIEKILGEIEARSAEQPTAA